MIIVLRNLLIAGVASAISCSAAASSWKLFEHGWNDDVMSFFDSDTVTSSAQSVKLWIKTVRSKVGKDGTSSIAELLVANCAQRTYRIATRTLYSESGSVIRSLTPPPTDYQPEPDSNAEEIVRVACARDFPNAASARFSPADENDPMLHAARFFFSKKMREHPLAK